MKNVAGYDMAKLFCGSQGRLGLIARASLRLHPLPEAARTLVVPVGDAGRRQALVRTLIHSPLVPSAVDLVWGGESPSSQSSSREARAAAADAAGARAARSSGGRRTGRSGTRRPRGSSGPARAGRSPAGELAAALGELPRALVRIGPTCFAYLPERVRAAVAALAERVRAEFDPGGVLA